MILMPSTRDSLTLFELDWLRRRALLDIKHRQQHIDLLIEHGFEEYVPRLEDKQAAARLELKLLKRTIRRRRQGEALMPPEQNDTRKVDVEAQMRTCRICGRRIRACSLARHFRSRHPGEHYEPENQPADKRQRSLDASRKYERSPKGKVHRQNYRAAHPEVQRESDLRRAITVEVPCRICGRWRPIRARGASPQKIAAAAERPCRECYLEAVRGNRSARVPHRNARLPNRQMVSGRRDSRS
jgi:hypothetical protein